MTINEVQDDIIRRFDAFDDWMEAYEYLIDLARSLPTLDAAYRTDEYAVGGCQSSVWMTAELRDGKLYFRADSDSTLTKGILALLLQVVDNQPPDIVADSDLYFLERIGLQSHLSPSRANGVAGVVNRMKQLAAQTAE